MAVEKPASKPSPKPQPPSPLEEGRGVPTPSAPVPDRRPPPCDDLDAQIDRLNFGVEKSLRYHQRMRGHYDMAHKLMAFLIIAGGSAAFADFAGWAHYLGAAVAVLAAAELVWGVSRRSRDHEILAKRFSDLAIDIRTGERTQEAFDGWTRKRMRIESDEPPIYWAVEADCDNEVRRAWGKEREMVQIGWWSRLTMHIHRHASSHYATSSR